MDIVNFEFFNGNELVECFSIKSSNWLEYFRTLQPLWQDFEEFAFEYAEKFDYDFWHFYLE